MRVARLARSWLAVNGGVALIAALVCAVDKACTSFLPEKHLLASVASTGSLYALVFISCSLNLRGRRRFIGGKLDRPKQSPVLYSSIVWHPLGSILERYLHGAAQDGIAADVGVTLLSSSMVTFGASVVRLLAFEATFDFIFYFAHRAVHLPGVYDKVHKLHHAHKHDVSLISGLQMGPADVLITHTIPVLLALSIVPLEPGFNYTLGKTYLLFQELYGHAGVSHKGRNFGLVPWLPSALGFELKSEDHQLHHIKANVNYSKRFSFMDKLFGTWSAPEMSSRKAAENYHNGSRTSLYGSFFSLEPK